MTNAEKYLKDNVSVEELDRTLNNMLRACKAFNEEMENAIKKILPNKPTLTEDERVILRNLAKEYTTIEREEELKGVRIYTESGTNTYLPYFDLFQFIKERRRIFY